MDKYLSGRSVYTNREVPLLDVVGQPYVHYFKGAVAMYTLRERLGAEAVNGALRRFREKFAGADAPPADVARAVRGAAGGHAGLAAAAAVGPVRAHHALGRAHGFRARGAGRRRARGA